MKPLTVSIKKALGEEANPAKATEMRRYMKSEMPYRGVPAPAQKKIFSVLFKQHPVSDQNTWHEAVLDLWREAEFREERYASIALTGVKKYRRFQTMQSLAVYEEMILTGAWWDIIDSLSNRLGELLVDHKRPMTSKMYSWAKDKNMWKRRSSILCQLKLKKATDVDLLFENARINMSDREFFIRKAIGWALREYSKTSPPDIINFVHDHRAELSPLSKKEGLKVLIKQGTLESVPV
jgi:3-methyladenine DNA glycosylase AlkD